MAFIDQVQDLTSLTVSDNDELSQFLKDGVLDVTNRWLSIRPQDIELFTRESAETTSNASLNLNGAKIISIIRENGTNNQWRKCRKIPPELQYDITDVDSLNYASKINPAYMVGDAGKISVFPTPGVDPNAFKVYYVNKDPVNSSGSALIHSHDDILYFPIDKVYLVVIYAGMKLLQANMGATTISDLSITAVPPDVPTLSSITFSSLDSAIDATLVAAATSTTLGGSSTAPTYTKPTQTFDITQFETFLETNEDTELAQVQMARLQHELGEFQADIQNELNEFNKENVAYQSSVQEAMAEFQSGNQIAIGNAERSQNRQLQNAINDMKVIFDDNAQSIQKFATELQEYQAEIGQQVQEYTQNLQADGVGYQWLQDQYTRLKAEYDQAFMMAAPKPQAQGGR